MSRKITIIGAGSVGATIAYTLSNDDIASEIVMIDINKQKAEGEVLDIIQGTCFREPISIIAGDYEDAAGSDIVIITSGIARKPGQTRLELAQTNVNILKSIAPQIAKAAPDAKYIIVSNPVDVMTYVFTKVSGIPENQIIGSGTVLDTARLRCGISEHFGIAQKNVHAYIFGEHGDSSFVPWSLANIGSVPVEKYAAAFEGGNMPALDKDDVEDYIRKSGGIIIAAKKCTNYAIGVTTATLCEALNYDTDSVLTISSMMNGEYGIDDVCLSIPSVVGAKGLTGHIVAPLTDAEIASLRHSADCLKDVIKQIQF